MARRPDPAIRSALADNLCRAREASGLSQEDVGLRADLHRTEISVLERGLRLPRVDTVIKFAGALGVWHDPLKSVRPLWESYQPAKMGKEDRSH